MPREIDEAWIDEAIARYRRIEGLRADFEKAVTAHVVSVHSPDDTIEVQVTAAGEIVDVRIGGRPQDRAPADLAREIQAVVGTATEAARWARRKLHDEVFGTYGSLAEG